MFVFQGRWRLLWLLRGFLWLSWLFISHHLHSQFLSFRILCIASSDAAGGFLAFWLFGFLAFWLFGFLAFWLFGFLAFWLLAAFWLWLFAS